MAVSTSNTYQENINNYIFSRFIEIKVKLDPLSHGWKFVEIRNNQLKEHCFKI